MINNLNQTSFTQQCVLVMIVIRNQFTYPKGIALVIFTITLIQPLFMILESGMQSTQSGNLFHQVALLLFRQDLLLLHYEIDYSLLFIIVLITHCIHKITQSLITFQLSRIKDIEKQFQRIDDCSPLKLVMTILSLYTHLQLTILHLPFSTLCIMSVASSMNHITNGETTYTAQLLLAILTYILWQFDYLITFSISSTPLTFKYGHLDVQYVTILHYFEYLLKQLQVIVFCILKDQVRLIEQVFLLICIASQLANQFHYETYIFKEQRYLLMHITSLNTVIGIYYFSYDYNSQFIEYLIIPLLIYPIILNALLKIDDIIHNQLFTNLFKDQNTVSIPKLIQQLKLILNQCDIREQMIPYKSSLINRFHRLQCPNTETCICTNKLYVSEIPQANAITQSILKGFLHQKIMFLMNQLDKQITQMSDFNYQELILIRTILLYDFGWWTESIKNLAQLINCQMNNQNYIVKSVQIKKVNREDSNIESSTKKEDQLSFLRLKIELNQIDYCRLLYLLYWAKQKLKSYLGTSMSAHQQLIVSDFIHQYLLYDQCLKEVQTRIVDVMSHKINFYYKVIQDDKQDLANLGKLTMDICLKLSNLKKWLKRIYKRYPCITIQRCLCFFQCELLNNYYEANKTTTLASMQDDKLFKSKKIINYDIQVENTAYAVLSIKGDLDDFEIEYTSPQFMKLLGRSRSQIIRFSDLLPKFMKNWHPLFIHKFFNDGQSRYYKSFNQSFVQTNLCLLKTVYLCYDITKIFINQNLVFAGFVQDVPDQKCFVLCHGMNMRLTLSENFFKRIGFDQRVILGLPQASLVLTGLYLQYLLPNFAQLQQKFDGETFQSNTELRFFDDKYLKEAQQEGVDLASVILDFKQWQKEEQIIMYHVNIMVTKRYVSQECYLHIEFSSITKFQKYGLDVTTQKCQTVRNSELISDDEINDSFASLMNLSGEAEPRKINIFDVRMKEFLQNELVKCEEEEPVNIASYRKEDMNNVVPQSHRQLLSVRKNEIQQEFFNIELFQMDSMQQSSLEQPQSPTKKKKPTHNPADDIQSQQSSIGGIKESQLFKKFEMIEKIIKKKKFEKMLLYLSLILLQVIFFICYNLVVITLVSSEILQFIHEIDMISLHASIMAPHDMYLSIKVTISAYQQQYREKFISNATLYQLIDPLYQFNDPYYMALQSNFYDVLENQNLQSFLNDQTVTMYLMGNNDSVTYPEVVSFREELMAILNAQYQFKRVFDARKNANGQACQVLQFANYFNVQDKLEELTDQILDFSKNRSTVAINKWFLVWLIFQIFALILGIGALYLKRNILKMYEKILNFFYFSDKASLEQEIQKLKNLNSIIQQSSEIIYKYDFNFKDREDLVNKKKLEQTTIKIDKPRTKSSQKMSKIMPIVTFLCMYIYFCGYSVIIKVQTESYLTKYHQTTDFYRLVQDLRFRSGNLYVYREIFFRWSNFTYLNSSDLNRLYSLVDKGQNVIQEYLNYLSNIENDHFLFSDSYIQFVSQIQDDNLCLYIDQKYSNLSQYCSISLNGVLLKGMVPSLNYISKDIRSQQAINNFTKRVEVHFYELEGAQVISLAFFNMSSQLKQGMIDLTANFNTTNQILSYLFLASQLIISFVYVTCFRKSFLNEFKMYKKSLYLIPIQVLLGDNSLERALRQFEFTEKI